MKYATSIPLLLVLLLGGCSLLDDEQQNRQMMATSNQDLGNIEMHTSDLADELFAGLGNFRDARYAVAGFVPVRQMQYNGEAQGPLMLLGHQLEQGLMTEADRRGFVTQDYKLTKDIIMHDDSDRALSRELNHLQGQAKADFFITGTITEQQGGAIVNARIVHIASQDVVGAATKFFPNRLFWGAEKVTTRGGMLYRSESHY